MKQGNSKIEVISTKPAGGWAVKNGRSVTLIDHEDDRVFSGSVRIKAVNCGKAGCTKCPHHIYAYAQFRKGKKVTEKYLGVAR